jgi:hypothetical protein
MSDLYAAVLYLPPSGPFRELHACSSGRRAEIHERHPRLCYHRRMTHVRRGWVLREDAVRAAVLGARTAKLHIGGRYGCAADAEEDAMAATLAGTGLDLSDSGQCEVVASLAVQATTPSILNAIELFRDIASTNGYRLQAVETVGVAGGAPTVLASEVGYIS